MHVEKLRQLANVIEKAENFRFSNWCQCVAGQCCTMEGIDVDEETRIANGELKVLDDASRILGLTHEEALELFTFRETWSGKLNCMSEINRDVAAAHLRELADHAELVELCNEEGWRVLAEQMLETAELVEAI